MISALRLDMKDAHQVLAYVDNINLISVNNRAIERKTVVLYARKICLAVNKET